MPELRPTISVLMPVYNGALYLHEAIESILKQSFADFEFVIIDDGSTDNSVDIVKHINDSRIRLISNATNIGLTKSLNKGLDVCRGEYIARMDADDIAHPDRLQMQLEMMQSNNNLVVCGSSIETMGSAASTWQCWNDDQAIRAEMLFSSPLFHPTAMIRRSALSGHGIRYNEQLANAQDYDIWYQLSRVGELATIGKPLLKYRLHANQTDKGRQRLFADRVRKSILQRALGINEQEIPPEYFLLSGEPTAFGQDEVKSLIRFFRHMEMKNRSARYVQPGVLRRMFVRKLAGVIRQSQKMERGARNLQLLKVFLDYPEQVLYDQYQQFINKLVKNH